MENKDVFELIIDNAIEIFLAFDNDYCVYFPKRRYIRAHF